MHFPPCIQKILLGEITDGKKRALFILINFLKSLGWPNEDIKAKLIAWNDKNQDKLRENYVISQLNWHSRQKESKLAPNCDNAAYYKDLRVCMPDAFCPRIKNPVNYSLFKFHNARKAAEPTKRGGRKINSVKEINSIGV